MKISKWILATVTGSLLCTVIIGCAGTASGVTKGVLDKVFEDEPSEVFIRIIAYKWRCPETVVITCLMEVFCPTML